MPTSSIPYSFSITTIESAEKFAAALDQEKPQDSSTSVSGAEDETSCRKLEESYKIVNINEYLSDPSLEQKLLSILDEFRSPKNENVECFLKKDAIAFAKNGQAVSYLVFRAATDEFVGYFTLCTRPITIASTSNTMSNAFKERIEPLCTPDENGTYSFFVYLIAQLGKNYGVSESTRIDGKDLLRLAYKTVLEMKRRIGGVAVLLECEDSENDFLKNFYLDNGYAVFGERVSDENKKLYQLVKSIW